MVSDPKENVTLRQARKLIRAKQYPEAVAFLTAALTETVGDRQLLELLGTTHFLAGSHEDARAAFEKLTRADPMYAGGWVNLGAVCNVLGDFRRATEVLRKAIQRDRHCASAYYNLGIAQKGMQQPDMAISAYREAVKLDASLAEAWLNLGNLYMDTSKFKAAVDAFSKGLQASPNSAKLKHRLTKAEESMAGTRRVDPPFGRLVNEEELAKRQARSRRRDLDAATRNHEREEIRAIVKELRHNVRPIVPLLDETLHRELHLLHLAVVEKDTRGESPAAYDAMQQTIQDLDAYRAKMVEVTGEIRAHLKRTDPGL
ncbi:MAG: tetratricopeptide repeat protein [Planctomycetaceae bacterium]